MIARLRARLAAARRRDREALVEGLVAQMEADRRIHGSHGDRFRAHADLLESFDDR